MIPSTHTCQPDRLEAFLNGKLSSRDEEQFAAHLDECSMCRRSLDDAAAAPDAWTRASAFLRDDPFDRMAISGFSDEPQTLQPQIKQVLDFLGATDDPAMLGRLGSYEVSGVVGAGGMGVVLKALDRPLDRTVAIKVMAPHLATSGAARQRFSREARAAAAVIHPNVIAIYGVSTDTPLPYLVMPYVAGASLQKRLDTEGALPVADVLRIGIQIASGLAAAHNQGLVHRDIKPANILLDQGVDRLVITDFGLARTVDDASVTRTGVIAGTPQYMSPEQARGEPVDARSDLFSFGSVLYAACTGRVPFRAESPYGVLRRITDNLPRPIREINPQIPEWLCNIINRLHAKSAEDRFQSAEELAQLLTQCLAHLTQPTVHSLPKEFQRSRKLLNSQRLRVLFISTASIMLLAITYLFATWSYDSVKNSSDDWVDTKNEPTPNPLATLENEGVSVLTHGITLEAPSQDASANNWNDDLSPVLQHVERSLQSLQQIQWPPVYTPHSGLVIFVDRSRFASQGQVNFGISLGNNTYTNAEDVRMTLKLPRGLKFVSGGLQPIPTHQTENLCVWDQGILPAMRQLDVMVELETTAFGTFDVEVQVESRGGQTIQNVIRTEVPNASVNVNFAPAGGVSQAEVGSTVNFEIEVKNTSQQTLNALMLTIETDAGLVEATHESNIVQNSITQLLPEETRRVGAAFRIFLEGDLKAKLSVKSGDLSLVERTSVIHASKPKAQ